MEIALNIGWVILGLAGLYYGAEWLVRGSAGIALSVGISALVVGLTIVAFGTSTPELIVSIQANLKGNGDFALGNVIGSNICNIGLVLAVAAIMTPIAVHQQIINRELPFLVLTSVVFSAFILVNSRIGRLEGLIFSIGIVVYTFLCIRIASKNPEDPIASVEEEVDEIGDEGESSGFVTNLILVVVGLALLAVGSDRLVAGGEFLATTFGVSEAVIALTLVAFGTSLPELATTVVACLRNESELAAGNAIGSCLFNLLCVSGFTALIKPIESQAIAIEDLVVMTGFATALFILMRTTKTLGRISGALMLVVYLAYVVFLGIRG